MVAAFTVQVPWGEALKNTVVPSLRWDPGYLAMIVAVLGTTISPYLFFWQASTEVEELRQEPADQPLKHAPEQAPAQFWRIKADTYLGMGVSNLIAWFIMLTTAATLHAAGKTEIRSAAEAAAALEPVAGPFAKFLFAAGVIGTGLLAVPVLAGSAAYGLGEALRWPTGLERKPLKARGFYGIIALATLGRAGDQLHPHQPHPCFDLGGSDQWAGSGSGDGADDAAYLEPQGDGRVYALTSAQNPGLAGHPGYGAGCHRSFQHLGEVR